MEQAANQGHERAQYQLGVLYAEGRGVAINNDRAIELLQAAANAGMDRAVEYLQKHFKQRRDGTWTKKWF